MANDHPVAVLPIGGKGVAWQHEVMTIDPKREQRYLPGDFPDAVRDDRETKCFYADCEGVLTKRYTNGYNATTKRTTLAGSGTSVRCPVCGFERWIAIIEPRHL